jgi:glycine amidinotransferase
MIETPMAWRSRYFEVYAYRDLLNEYFDAGARWTSAPKPMLDDRAYDYHYTPPNPGEPMRYMLTEAEPLFDAADFTRCGRDLFYTRSNVTNKRGVEWLRRHLGPEYKLHEIETRCTRARC